MLEPKEKQWQGNQTGRVIFLTNTVPGDVVDVEKPLKNERPILEGVANQVSILFSGQKDYSRL